jgi:hypothetical protein
MKTIRPIFIWIVSLAAGTGLATSLCAKEVDTFSLTNHAMADVAALLDADINSYLDQAIEESNAAAENCSKEALYRSVRNQFGNHVFDRFTKELFRSKTFPKTAIKVSDSIYDGVGPSAPILWLQNQIGSELIAVQYNGIRIGLDKLEHFFGSGYLYFEKHYLQGMPLSEALHFGAQREIGILGGRTTGVISFADLSANFNGMRFWNHLLNENPDAIGDQKPGPYVACKDSRWAQVRAVTLESYVDRTWDETINCNRYSSIRLARNVQDNVEQLSRKFQKILSCENQATQLAAFEPKYRSISPWILNLPETEIDRHFPDQRGHRLPVSVEDEQ